MKDAYQSALDSSKAIDRMINEGLGSGSIIPRYTEAHLKLKGKQEAQLRSSKPVETSKIKKRQ